MSNAVIIKDAVKKYGDFVALKGVSLDIKEGEFFTLLGPSGCGKTTLMRLILGLEKPDSGKIFVPENALFSCVFQEDRLINHFTAEKNLKLVQKDGDDSRAKELLTMLGLAGSLKKPVRELSGGMARRVSLARCLIYDADIILMDEPLKGLDAATRDRAISVIKRFTKGKTLILITHDLTEAQSFDGEMVKLKLS